MTHKLDNPSDLPMSTAWLFPEYNFATMDVRKHRYVIMERILEHGNWNEINWLFEQYHTRSVRAWMRRWGFRALSRQSFALWKLVLNIRRFDAPAWALDAQADKVSFIYQHHPLLEPTVDLDGLALASPTDIGLMKLAAIRDRGTRRDFVDVFCLREIVPLTSLIDLVGQKYADRPDFAAILALSLIHISEPT